MNPIKFYMHDLNDYLLASIPLTDEKVNASLALYLKHEKHIDNHSLYVCENGLIELSKLWQVAYRILDFLGLSHATRKTTIESALLQIIEYATIKKLIFKQDYLQQIESFQWTANTPVYVKRALVSLAGKEFPKDPTYYPQLKTIQGKQLRTIQRARLDHANTLYYLSKGHKSWFSFSCDYNGIDPSDELRFGSCYYKVFGDLCFDAEENHKPMPTAEKTSRHFQAFLMLFQIDEENGLNEQGQSFPRFGDDRLKANFIVHHQNEINESYNKLCCKGLKDIIDLQSEKIHHISLEELNSISVLYDRLIKPI